MRIAVVGPTHPIKGGVSQHTTVLAHRLVDAGHEVEIISWLRQYPKIFYPGQQNVTEAELRPFNPTRRMLSWNRPDSWWREARRLRDFDLIVFAHITPVQVPPYRLMLAVASRARTRNVVIAHNVLPHERSWVDRVLVSSLLRATDRVIVHSQAQAAIARPLTSRPIVVATMAPFMPDGFVRRAPAPGEHRRIVFFGLVRHYKGLDVLLRALAIGPKDVRLRIAGEFWGSGRDALNLCRELGINDRVEIENRYVPASDVPRLFADVDALVLPYRSSTGSQGVWTGFEFGVPVIATNVGRLPDDIRMGIDGLVAEPDDVDSLAAKITEFYQPGVPERMRAQVRPVDPAPYWHRYLDALLGNPPDHPASDESRDTDWGAEGVARQNPAPPGGRLIYFAKLGAEQVLWARVGLRRRWAAVRHHPRVFPRPVHPTDVLGTTMEYENAIAECHELHLPLHHGRAKNWDALGAVSVIVHELGTDIRVLDAGAARYSSILPWLRLLGVRELIGNNLEFTHVSTHDSVRFEYGDITATAYRKGFFDAVTCMSVIEHGVPLDSFLAEIARIVRPGGILVVSTDYDQDPPDTTGKIAYGAQVKIFGPEDIRDLVDRASQHGLKLVGDLRLTHPERPVYWKRTGLHFTFIRLTFVRADGEPPSN